MAQKDIPSSKDILSAKDKKIALKMKHFYYAVVAVLSVLVLTELFFLFRFIWFGVDIPLIRFFSGLVGIVFIVLITVLYELTSESK